MELVAAGARTIISMTPAIKKHLESLGVQEDPRQICIAYKGETICFGKKQECMGDDYLEPCLKRGIRYVEMGGEIEFPALLPVRIEKEGTFVFPLFIESREGIKIEEINVGDTDSNTKWLFLKP